MKALKNLAAALTVSSALALGSSANAGITILGHTFGTETTCETKCVERTELVDSKKTIEYKVPVLTWETRQKEVCVKETVRYQEQVTVPKTKVTHHYDCRDDCLKQGAKGVFGGLSNLFGKIANGICPDYCAPAPVCGDSYSTQ